MTIAPDLTAQILRYHHAERWPVGTISSQLNVHRETVIRVLTQAGASPIIPAQRPSGVTPYLPFIEQTLKQFPNLTASRLHAMVVERALNRGVPHPNAVRLALERQRQAQTPPPLGVALPEHVRARDIAVRPHSLSGYDQLIGDQDDAND